MRRLLPIALLALPLRAQEAPKPAPPRVTLTGFVSTSVFAQSQSFGFGNGQNAAYASSQQVPRDSWFLGGDVRNTRLTMGVTGPEPAPGWTARGTVEVDFFGGFNGTGAYAPEQPVLRLRTVFADITHGRTTVRMGQALVPMWGQVATSLSHLAFPLGFGGAGHVGWREPGVFVTQGLSAPTAKTKVEVVGALFKGRWLGPGNVLDQQSAGEASDVPQAEARINVSGRVGAKGTWSAYAVGHFDRKDLSGVGPDTAHLGTLDGKAAQLGGKVVVGRLTMAGNGFAARAIGQEFGQLAQFGDIGSRGGWAQAGVALGSHLSVWSWVGGERANADEVRAHTTGAARTGSTNTNVMARWALGPYALGAEWLRARTSWIRATGPYTGAGRCVADQVAVSVLYSF